MQNSTTIIYDFNENAKLSDWRVIDDVVMGGKSYGNFAIDKHGVGVYSGEVSLENNGGFSSIRYDFSKRKITSFKKIKIRLRGDGKSYQFRIKQKKSDRHSYISKFKTTKDWSTVSVSISEMYPAFRGRILNMQNFNAEYIEQIAFLIGNKTNEKFKLEIDKIYLE